MKGTGRRLKNRLRGLYRSVQRSYVAAFRSYGADELASALHAGGVGKGRLLLLHSAFDERHGFCGGAQLLTDCILDAVGSDGGLFMVSLPYLTSTTAYLESGAVFDVRRTISRMGLISELFRRRQGVMRSLHPTHPVLGMGPDAARILSGHERCAHGCGAGSPFERLLHADASVAFLNVPLYAMTYFHYLEHLVSPRLPFPLYAAAPFTVRVIGADGQASQIQVYGYSAEAMRRRQPHLLHGWLREGGLVRQVNVGATRIQVLGLKEVTDLVLRKAGHGEFFYDMAQ